jgi:homoserine dehydrogenase
VSREVFTTDASSIVADPDVDIVLELLGGMDPAKELILASFASGKPVVTANKELLANVGRELFDSADAASRDIRFEAAVAGGIPLIAPLKESLAGERVLRMLGIVNGTTNYVLTQMSEHGWTFEDALAEAQRLGYAKPIRAPTSTGSTPRPSARSSPRSRSTRESSRATCIAKGSRGSPPRTSPTLPVSATS